MSRKIFEGRKMRRKSKERQIIIIKTQEKRKNILTNALK